MWAEAAATTAMTTTAAKASAIRTRLLRPPIPGPTLPASRWIRQGLPVGVQRGLRRGYPRDRHPVRRAAHAVEARELAELDRLAAPAVLAANAQLDFRLGLPAGPGR